MEVFCDEASLGPFADQPEYNRNSILLVFGNRPEFDELQVNGSTISSWLSLVRQGTRRPFNLWASASENAFASAKAFGSTFRKRKSKRGQSTILDKGHTP